MELWCTGFEDLPLRPWAPRNDCTWSLHGSFVVDAAEERNGVAVGGRALPAVLFVVCNYWNYDAAEDGSPILAALEEGTWPDGASVLAKIRKLIGPGPDPEDPKDPEDEDDLDELGDLDAPVHFFKKCWASFEAQLLCELVSTVRLRRRWPLVRAALLVEQGRATPGGDPSVEASFAAVPRVVQQRILEYV